MKILLKVALQKQFSYYAGILKIRYNISRSIFYPTVELLNSFVVGFIKNSNKLKSIIIDPLLFPTTALHKTQNSVGEMEKQVTVYLFYASI